MRKDFATHCKEHFTLQIICTAIVYLFCSLAFADYTSSKEAHDRTQRTILQISQEVGVDPLLFAAICYKESHFKYFYNVNDGGTPSYGPCQIKAITARHVKLYREYMTHEDTIRVGASYLKEKLAKCGNVRSALAAYNTGRCIKNPKLNGYVDSVLDYQKLLQSGKSLYNK